MSPAMSPPLAAYTMSGSPGSGRTSSTVWPRERYVWWSDSHCNAAARRSTGAVGSIQGLIAYSTAKNSGAVIT